MDISTAWPKSHIHTWIYPWIYQWISIYTATLNFSVGVAVSKNSETGRFFEKILAYGHYSAGNAILTDRLGSLLYVPFLLIFVRGRTVF